MKLSSKQASQLVMLLQSSLEKNIVGYLCYDYDTRHAMLTEILHQQDAKVVDLDENL